MIIVCDTFSTHWDLKKMTDAVPLLRGEFSRKSSQGTRHNPPLRASYGVYFVRSKSDPCSIFVTALLCPMLCNTGPRHNGTRLYFGDDIFRCISWKTSNFNLKNQTLLTISIQAWCRPEDPVTSHTHFTHIYMHHQVPKCENRNKPAALGFLLINIFIRLPLVKIRNPSTWHRLEETVRGILLLDPLS